MGDDRVGTVELRAATARDAETIATIWHQGWRDGHLDHVPDEVIALRSAQSFAIRTPERLGDTTVAVLDGRVVGFIMVVGDEVEQVYLSADHRGAGIADVLLAEAEHQVGANGHRVAWLAVVAGNARARSFYHRRGWTDDGAFAYSAETATPEQTVDVPCQRYVKRLAGPPS